VISAFDGIVDRFTAASGAFGEKLAAVRADQLTWRTPCTRAVGSDDTLRPDLVAWIGDHLAEIYDGLAESPVTAESAHRFFAAPPPDAATGASRQERLLIQMGRRP
jgi:hypothetical protein